MQYLKNNPSLSLLLCFIGVFSLGQLNAQRYIPDEVIAVEKDGQSLWMPWLGGLNNPQFSEADFNQDGLNDLFIMDRSDNQIFVLINTGSPGVVQYEWDRAMAEQFPPLEYWTLIRDYNCDEVPDIFTATDSGFKVFTGSLEEGTITFTEAIEEVYDQNGVIVSIAPTDLPAISDVNDDGYLDVLTFNPDGGFVFYYQNMAAECGELLFEIVDSCWGQFYESGISVNGAVDLGVGCDFGKPALASEDEELTSGLHPGSTILAIDIEGSEAKELILGDINFNNLVKLRNNGALDSAIMDSQDVFFPVYDIPLNLRSFPASFAADVNNDGLKDILVSPNSKENLGDYATSWYYQNVGTIEEASFSLQEEDFLINQMVEVGEFSHPAFFDYNGDGLLDMVVGNKTSSLIGETSVSSLFLYENIGTPNEPVFEFVTEDYLNLSVLLFEDLSPTFGDLNGDGVDDLICGTGNAAVPQGGDFNGILVYLKNKSSSGEEAVFGAPVIKYKDIDVKQKSSPQLVDVNLDGLLDLIIGNHNGVIYYYQNTGTAEEPEFELISDFWGKVDVRSLLLSGTGHARPFLTSFNETGQRALIVGSETGDIFWYELVEDSIEGGAFPVVTDKFSQINAGTFAHPHFADLNNDGDKELYLGLRRGGIRTFTFEEEVMSVESIDNEVLNVKLYPNPVDEIVNLSLKSGEKGNLIVYDVMGKVLFNGAIREKNQINVGNWPNGLYFFVITNTQNQNRPTISYKVTVQH